MLTLRWLNGEIHLRPAPCSRNDLEQYVFSTLDSKRNTLVKLIRENQDEEKGDLFHPDETVSVLVLPETQLTGSETSEILQRFGNLWNPYSEMSFRDRMNSVSDPELCLQFDKFRKIIMKYGALVSGDAILCSFENTWFDTFDVLVHHSISEDVVKEFTDRLSMRVEEILTLSTLCTREFDEFDYDLARQRGILAYVVLRSTRCLVKVTVAVVHNQIPLKEAAVNSDLSFCDTWWDGDVIHAVDPDGIRKKEGVLKYEKLFWELNLGVSSRMRTYRDRGYTIQISLPTNTIVVAEKSILEKEEEDRVWPLHFFLSTATEVLNLGRSLRFFSLTYPDTVTHTVTIQVIQELWPEEVIGVMAKKILTDSDWVENRKAKQFATTFRAYLFDNPREEKTFMTDWQWNGEIPLLRQHCLAELKDRFLKSLGI